MGLESIDFYFYTVYQWEIEYVYTLNLIDINMLQHIPNLGYVLKNFVIQIWNLENLDWKKC